MPADAPPEQRRSPRPADLAQHLLRYLELRISYELLQSRARVAPVLGSVLAVAVVWLCGGVALVMASLGLALVLDRALQPGVGFAIVASGYGMGALVLWRLREAVQAAFRRRIDALIDSSLATESDIPPVPAPTVPTPALPAHASAPTRERPHA